jgi:hypothetical protein
MAESAITTSGWLIIGAAVLALYLAFLGWMILTIVLLHANSKGEKGDLANAERKALQAAVEKLKEAIREVGAGNGQ